MSIIYGKYSMGSGSTLSDSNLVYSDVDNEQVIDSYKQSIKFHLEKSGVFHKIKDFSIMDVGTGRQSIAFHKLGVKNIKHYDISVDNIKRMKGFITENNLHHELTTENVDLVKYRLPKEYFDLVYLNGIVHHFSNTALGLINCMNAVKKGGYLFLYFYRAGTFPKFIVSILRDLVQDYKNVDEYFINAVLFFSNECTPGFMVSSAMDNFFVPYIHFYTTSTYIEFVQECGFEIISSSKLDPFGRDVDHQFAHESVILTCKRVDITNINSVSVKKLSPENSVNELDRDRYLDSPGGEEILETLDLYRKLKNIVVTKEIPKSVIMSIAFRLYITFKTNNCNNEDIDYNRHKQLRSVLNNIIELLDETI
jgi:SAM-dependent methyltransferase